jgi:tetratricopeptide (TPR) repeat protein
LDSGNYADAQKELEIAARLEPTLGDAFYFLALAAKQSNDTGRETEFLKRVVALYPDNADAQFLLGQSLEKVGKMNEAIEHWKQAVRADPNALQPLYNLARALSKTHDPEAAQYQARFDQLEVRKQVNDRVILLRNLALESGNAQNWPDAIEQLQEAIQTCGDCSHAVLLHKNLAYFYQRTGKISAAEEELGKAIALDPNDAGAQSALATLQNLPTAAQQDRTDPN